MFLSMDVQSITSRHPQFEHYHKDVTGTGTRTAFRLHSYKLIYQKKCSLHWCYVIPYLGARYRQQNSFFVWDMFSLLVNIKQHVIVQRLRRNNIKINKLKCTLQTGNKKLPNTYLYHYRMLQPHYLTHHVYRRHCRLCWK